MTTEEKIKQNTIVATALCAFPVLFIGIALVISETTGVLKPEFSEETFIWIFRGCTLGLLAMQMFIIRRFYENFIIKLPAGLDEKLNSYRTLLIIRLALFEAASFFATVIFILNGDYIQLGISAIAIAAMWYHFPTRNRMRRELQLNELEL